MNFPIESLSTLAVHPIVTLIAKVTIALALGGLVATVMRRRSAASRHFVWTMALTASMVLAGVAALAPSIDVVVARRTTITAGAAITTNSDNDATAIRAKRDNDATAITTGNAITASTATAAPAPIGQTPLAIGPTPLAIGPTLLAIWLAGFALLMLWRVLGHAGLLLLSRRTLPINDPLWHRDLATIARQLGVRRAVRIVRSADVGAPVTWGHRHPVVLVPADALEWSADRRRAVLLHELAHIARNDYAVQFGAALACAIYWFHPLVWIAARHLRNEAERACDDRALAAGIRGADYADHLLHLARNSRTLKLAGAVAIGMARRSTLEGRMLAALDTSIVRASLTRTARGAAAFAFAVALLPVAAVRPVLGSVVETPTTADATNAAATIVTVPALVVSAAPQSSTGRTIQRPATTATTIQADTIIVRTFTVSRRGTLGIDLDGGSITIEGWNENRVEVRVEIKGSDWRDIDMKIEQRSNDVQIIADHPDNRSWRANVVVTVRVPREYDLHVESGGGNLAIADVSGRIEGRVGGGTLELRNLSGEAVLATGGGAITITDSNLDGTVSTGGGNITLTRVTGDLRPETGGGMITRDGGTLRSPVTRGTLRSAETREAQARAARVEVARGDRRTSVYSGNDESRSVSSDGVVHISKGSGAVDISSAPNGASISTGGGNVQIAEAGGPVRVTTGGGTISLGSVAGTVDATTGGGDVNVVVTGGSSAHRVNVTTGAGRVVIEIPRDFAGSVRLESGIPRDGDMPKFTTPWNLTDETIVTENNRGRSEPSRSLRATGTVGNGRGEIRVTTGRGDIEIRYAR